MKNVYVVSVQWEQNDKWHNAILNVFSNKRAAQSYVDTKQAAGPIDPNMQNYHYYMEKFTCWSHNYLESE